MKVYRKLKGCPGFPNLITMGITGGYDFITIDLLGPSLQSLVKSHGRPFGLQTVAMVGVKLLDRLEALHVHNIVHCDLKPDNVTIGYSDSNEIYLIDFGLSRTIMNADQLQEPYKIDRIVGSMIFIGLGAHKAIISFRNDVESMAYLLLFLLNGDLPWTSEVIAKKAKGSNMIQLLDAVYQLKSEFMDKVIGHEMPPIFIRLFEAIRSMSHVDRPDYNALRRILKYVFQSFIKL